MLAHAHRLPIDSSFVAELRGGQQFRGWDETRYLLAAITNALRVQNYLFLLANKDPKKPNPKPPEPWPLPDKKVRQKQPVKPGSFAFIAKAQIAAVKKLKEGGG